MAAAGVLPGPPHTSPGREPSLFCFVGNVGRTPAFRSNRTVSLASESRSSSGIEPQSLLLCVPYCPHGSGKKTLSSHDPWPCSPVPRAAP